MNYGVDAPNNVAYDHRIMAAAVHHITQRRKPSRLRLRRQALGLSQREVAACLAAYGITRDGLARVELGENWPNPRQIVALAHFFGVEVGTMAADIIAGWLARRNQSNLLLLASKGRFDSHQPSLPLGGQAS